MASPREEELALSKKKSRLAVDGNRSMFRPKRSPISARRCERGAGTQDVWRRNLIAYAQAHSAEAKEFGRRMHGDLPTAWEAAIPHFDPVERKCREPRRIGCHAQQHRGQDPRVMAAQLTSPDRNLTLIKGAPTYASRFRPRDATSISASESTPWAPS